MRERMRIFADRPWWKRQRRGVPTGEWRRRVRWDGRHGWQRWLEFGREHQHWRQRGQGGVGGRGTGGSPSSGGTGGSGAGGGGGRGTGGSPSSGGAGGSGTGGGGGRGTGGSPSSGGTGGGSSDGGITSTTTIPGDGCTPPAAYADLFVSLSGHTQADSDAKVAAAWTKLFTPSGSGSIYFNGPGSDESYVKDTYNNDVRTEGMGYGLVIAVQLNHQTEFDRLWTWVRNHMATGCSASGCTGKQIAWHCSTSGSVLSSGGAPDGDEYFAAGLVFAAKRWGNTSGKYNYATEAQWVLNLVRTQDFNATYHLVKFYSGSDNGQTDASYILPASIKRGPASTPRTQPSGRAR